MKTITVMGPTFAIPADLPAPHALRRRLPCRTTRRDGSVHGQRTAPTKSEALMLLKDMARRHPQANVFMGM